MSDHSAGADSAPGADRATGQDGGPNPNQRALTNAHIASQVNTGRNVAVRLNLAVVIHGTARIDNDIFRNDGTRVDDCASAQDNARTEFCARR